MLQEWIVYQQIIVRVYQLCQAVGLAIRVLPFTCRANSTINNATSIHNYYSNKSWIYIVTFVSGKSWKYCIQKNSKYFFGNFLFFEYRNEDSAVLHIIINTLFLSSPYIPYRFSKMLIVRRPF